MKKPHILALEINPNSYRSVDIKEAIGKIHFHCRANEDMYLAHSPFPGVNFFEIKNNTFLEWDMEGGDFHEVLGPNLTIENDWADLDEWTVDLDAWTLNAGVLDKDADGTGTIEQNIASLEANQMYEISVDITNRTVGNFTITLGGTEGSNHNVDGHHVEYLTTANSTGNLIITPSSAARLSVANLKVEKVIRESNLYVKSQTTATYLEIFYLHSF